MIPLPRSDPSMSPALIHVSIQPFGVGARFGARIVLGALSVGKRASATRAAEKAA